MRASCDAVPMFACIVSFSAFQVKCFIRLHSCGLHLTQLRSSRLTEHQGSNSKPRPTSYPFDSPIYHCASIYQPSAFGRARRLFTPADDGDGCTVSPGRRSSPGRSQVAAAAELLPCVRVPGPGLWPPLADGGWSRHTDRPSRCLARRCLALAGLDWIGLAELD